MAPKSSKASPKPSPKASPKSKQAQTSTPRRSSGSTKIVKYEPPEPSVPQPLDVKFFPQQSDSASVLAKSLSALRDRGELCDVMLLVKGGSQLPAHSVVLTAQSEVFREMLRPVPPSEQNTSEAAEQSILADGPESAPLERSSQSYNAVGVGRKESSNTEFEMVPPRESSDKMLCAQAYKEVHLNKVTREAAEWLLKWLYGEITTDEYRPVSDDVNIQVMTLSEDLKIPSLMDLGACYLSRNVYAHNIVQRLWMCQRFALLHVREKLVEALVRDRGNLELVVQNPEMSKYPELLREMLAAVANQTGPPEEEGPPHKRAKK